MKVSPAELEANSWAFALEVYAWPGVADACLKLQSEAGVDVMMFLIIAFAAVRLRLLLTPTEIGELDQACRPWREQIVWPLRTIRSGLKTGPMPAPSSGTEQFRSKIKTAELAAERLQNQLLTQLLAERLQHKPPKRDAVNADELRSVLRGVVALFVEKCTNKPDADLLPSISLIADAVMQGVR